MTTAQTIIEQLGGNKFIAMTGAYNILKKNNIFSCMFRMCKKANLLKITLNDLDLYDVEFLKFYFKTLEFKTVKTYTNIYNDQLISVFENFTGLRTKL